MTDRQALKRARNAAGYKHVSGWAKAADADKTQRKLLTAEQVDAEIATKEQEK